MLLALLLSAAIQPAIAEYRRANPDESEAERILVYRTTPSQVEVAKLRARCTSAAWVTASVDRSRRTTEWLEAGRLLQNARRAVVGRLERRRNPERLVVSLQTGAGRREESLPIPASAWHLYDFDLASLTAVTEGRPAPRIAISFALPLAWNGEPPLLRDLGQVTLRPVRVERFLGRSAMRYQAVGTSASFRGGPLWLDRRDGRLLGVRWGTPNHAEYFAFHLSLVKLHPGGASRWRTMLSDHWRGCTAR
jgi:hypothetical protein